MPREEVLAAMKKDLDDASAATWRKPAYEHARGSFSPCPRFSPPRPRPTRASTNCASSFADYLYRAPYKFGGKEVDRVTMLERALPLEHARRQIGRGRASMSMGNVWSFPAPDVPYDTTLGAMKTLAEKIARDHARLHGVRASAGRESRARARVPEGGGGDDARDEAAAAGSEAVHAGDREPGRRRDPRRVRQTARPQQLSRVAARNSCKYDLAHYLDRRVPRRVSGSRMSLPKAAPRIRMYHSVGASDALTTAEVKKPIGDGLPETLEEWIPYSGVIAIKIKLNGGDLAWDVDRVVGDRSRHRRPRRRSAASRTGSTRSISTSAARTCSTCSISSTR